MSDKKVALYARAKGKVLGAPKRHADKEDLILHLSYQNLSHSKIGRLTGVSQSTVTRTIKALKSKSGA